MVRICGVVRESIVDGPGLRFVLFTQGCPHRCPGCHNPQSHDINGGYLCEEEKILSEFSKNPLLKGMTLSGGEPTLQAEALFPIAKQVTMMGKDIVLYSGYTFEELIKQASSRPSLMDLLKYTSLLVDGRYEEDQRSLSLLFRGSKNQRLIDVPASLQSGRAEIADLEEREG